MNQYLVVVDRPALSAQGSVWPVVVYKPASKGLETWIVNEILPKYSGSVVTLYEAAAVYRPATHLKELPKDDD